jgi:hypothetical protein
MPQPTRHAQSGQSPYRLSATLATPLPAVLGGHAADRVGGHVVSDDVIAECDYCGTDIYEGEMYVLEKAWSASLGETFDVICCEECSRPGEKP